MFWAQGGQTRWNVWRALIQRLPHFRASHMHSDDCGELSRASLEQLGHSDGDGGRPYGTRTRRALCSTPSKTVNGIIHRANRKGSGRISLWPSRASPRSHRGSIASPVKLLLLMMGRRGLFVIYVDQTPPPPHTEIPFTLQASIFPWPSEEPLHSATGASPD